ncbi:TPA: glycosyltransferase family 4 protein [Burkholderia stabilis]|nr:glycosyltransferase family 4 protein [Burkholderia stabilis]HDR9648701.1 glycosyltransferase family 4 protein [Burkholderia stabilis]HDR9654555.1 glycosyltransferase family 4 protein [Burkholderia stabilis]HDR9678421.1 glycosyltransferase family 4 protein [Burkholderia stabilis]
MRDLPSIAAAAALAAVACVAVLAGLLKTRLAWRLAIDTPNWRSLHTIPVPRVGGWGIVPAAVAASLVVGAGSRIGYALAGMAALAVLSFIDDRRGLPASIRFAVHFVVAGVFVWSLRTGNGLWAVIILGVATVWMTNLYNFMDGLDGLAGGMALFGFAAYAWAAAGHASELAVIAAALAGAALGFLVFNFHPAKIFLGDVGSIPLGFMAGALGLYGWRNGVWPLWYPAIVFSPFIADASLTLAKRAIRKEKIWEAHREHYYQRLVRMGMGHRPIAAVWYGLMAAAALLGIGMLSLSAIAQYTILVLWYLGLLVACFRLDAAWERFERQGST